MALDADCEIVRGETGAFFVQAPLGTDLTGAAAWGGMRLLPWGTTRLADPAAPMDLTFTAVFFPATVDAGPGCTFTYGRDLAGDALSLTLEAGQRYQADAFIRTAAGDLIYSGKLIVRAEEAAASVMVEP